MCTYIHVYIYIYIIEFTHSKHPQNDQKLSCCSEVSWSVQAWCVCRGERSLENDDDDDDDDEDDEDEDEDEDERM